SDRRSAFGPAEFVTGTSETSTVRLADGSVVRLAPESRLRIDNKGTGRDVWLEGRAYFIVTKREHQQFRVGSAAGDVVVLGTRFDVNTRTDQLGLVVVEGRVALEVGPDHVEVAANNHTRVARGISPITTTIAKVDSAVSWVGNLIVFQDTPLLR